MNEQSNSDDGGVSEEEYQKYREEINRRLQNALTPDEPE
jgi:hypothetical protein